MLQVRPSLRSRKGFTLMELLVVCTVVGILATVAVPSFARAREKSQNGAVTSNVHTVQLAVEQCAVDRGGLVPNQIFGNGPTNDYLIDTSGQSKLGYLPGDKLPATPYGTIGQQSRQATNIAVSNAVLIPAAQTGGALSANDALNHVMGTGSMPSVLLGPFRNTDYGAVSFDADPSGNKYVLYGTGSLNRQAIVAAAVGNN